MSTYTKTFTISAPKQTLDKLEEFLAVLQIASDERVSQVAAIDFEGNDYDSIQVVGLDPDPDISFLLEDFYNQNLETAVVVDKGHIIAGQLT